MALVDSYITSLNNKIGGCSIVQEGEDFFIVGADAVRKKLGEYEISVTSIGNGTSDMTGTVTITHDTNMIYVLGAAGTSLRNSNLGVPTPVVSGATGSGMGSYMWELGAAKKGFILYITTCLYGCFVVY